MLKLEILTGLLIFLLYSYSEAKIGSNSNAFARTNPSESLVIPTSDPLLPPSSIERSLSSFEKKRIREKIKNLELQANQKLREGQVKEAFKLWFRQLRLYRAIDFTTEIIALGKVGETAWQNNRGNELKVITQRLKDIYREQQTNNFTDAKALKELAIAWQKSRNINNAIAVYQILLERAYKEDNLQLEKKYLVTLGKLYLSKFDYTRAATIYEDLLSGDRYKITSENREVYLSKLISIYGYTKQPELAIVTKKKLIDRYIAAGKNYLVGKIKLSLAKDYQSLENRELAIVAYKEAVDIGQSLQQLALTSEALESLGSLYQQQEQYSLALETYQRLLELERKADNSYGVMNGYKQLGQLYLILEEYQQASIAFNRGLEIARLLDYQIGEFTSLINEAEKFQ